MAYRNTAAPGYRTPTYKELVGIVVRIQELATLAHTKKYRDPREACRLVAESYNVDAESLYEHFAHAGSLNQAK